VSGARQRAEKRVRTEVIRWALSDAVYQELMGTLTAKDVDWRPIRWLAAEVDRYVMLEEGATGHVDLELFIRAQVPRSMLDRSASELRLPREGMWQRFVAAVAVAKEGERWQQYPEALDKALRAVDWDELEANDRAQQSRLGERHLRFPKSQMRWSATDDAQLRLRFNQLWEGGMDPPIHGAETGNKLLATLSDEFGRTPGAIWQRLVRHGLMSAVPARNRETLERRRQGQHATPVEEPRTAVSIAGGRGLLDARQAELDDAIRDFVAEGRDFLVIISDQQRSYYVQLARLRKPDASPTALIYGEAVGNANLQPDDRLSPQRLSLLRELGWSAPDERDRMPPRLRESLETDNWWQVFWFFDDGDDNRERVDRERIVGATIETLMRVYEYDGSELEIESGSFE
jgi:hypothetical protein